MKKVLFLLALVVVFTAHVNGQVKDSTIIKADKTSFGLGMGFDYGGFGGNLVVYPINNLGLFAGVGYAINGVGFNGGLKVRLNAENANKVKPFFTAMYGYVDSRSKCNTIEEIHFRITKFKVLPRSSVNFVLYLFY